MGIIFICTFRAAKYQWVLQSQHRAVELRVRRCFRFQSEKLNQSENCVLCLEAKKCIFSFVSHRSETAKKAECEKQLGYKQKKAKLSEAKLSEAKRKKTKKLLNLSLHPFHKPKHCMSLNLSSILFRGLSCSEPSL